MSTKEGWFNVLVPAWNDVTQTSILVLVLFAILINFLDKDTEEITYYICWWHISVVECYIQLEPHKQTTVQEEPAQWDLTERKVTFEKPSSALDWRTYLVVHWVGICLMQGTPIRSLVWEDSTCHGQLKPVCRNYWAHAPAAIAGACVL